MGGGDYTKSANWPFRVNVEDALNRRIRMSYATKWRRSCHKNAAACSRRRADSAIGDPDISIDKPRFCQFQSQRLGGRSWPSSTLLKFFPCSFSGDPQCSLSTAMKPLHHETFLGKDELPVPVVVFIAVWLVDVCFLALAVD